ncbi:hypothetical protein GC175_17440 [bacterium]|jgi:hypothetical protein|nr:hypothetical protein [bacterium]
METSQELKETLNETRAKLSGYERRRFMAQIVEHMFGGNQTQAEKILGWNRKTLRKALSELRANSATSTTITCAGVSPLKSICRSCWKTCVRSWMDKARPTPPFARHGFLRV